MNSSARIVVLPALAAALVLGGSACAAPGTGPQASGTPGTPGATDAPATTLAARAGSDALVVAAAQPGTEQTAVSTPAAGAHPATASAARNVQLAAYDPATGTVVLKAVTTGVTGGSGSSSSASPTAKASGATAKPSAGGSSTAKPSAGSSSTTEPSTGSPSAPAGTPSAGASQPASADPAETVRPGQLIASPPTAAAPKGALLAVTSVQPAKDGSVTAATRPATLAELLGPAEADGKVAVDPHAITVKPLVKDLKLTFGKDGGTSKADASGTLQLDLNAPVALPGGSASASGSLQLRPAVHFAYHGADHGSPRTASVGFDLGAHAQWKVSGELARTTGANPIRVPFAELHANPVLNVGGLPVVVNLGLTCFLEVNADGKVTMEAEQQFDGAWAVQAKYTGGHGWSPVTDTGDTRISPVKAQLSGNASVRAGLGAEVNVGLFNAVGVDATVEPYVRAQGEGSVAVETSKGSTPQARGSLALYGGVDLTGALSAHLSIFGTPVVNKQLPLPGYHKEWLLKSFGSAPAPSGK
ncbi:hypothetical protein [Kitasatospora sp. HPMI-4]|uniref:hypothetical protein n=1 Tax=Kitasatospora sp. HPMI-4 TaxID=3448443 RepID=UPI003F1C9B3A